MQLEEKRDVFNYLNSIKGETGKIIELHDEIILQRKVLVTSKNEEEKSSSFEETGDYKNSIAFVKEGRYYISKKWKNDNWVRF